MKLRLLLLASLWSFVGILPAQTPRPAAPAEAKTDAKAKAKTKAPPLAPKEQGTIAGQSIARPDGTFLGLTLEEGRFKLAFYDKEKKPAQADALRAAARWPNPHGPGQNRTIMNPAGDGTYLLGAQFVRGPYSFKLFVTLILSEDGARTETYSVDFRG